MQRFLKKVNFAGIIFPAFLFVLVVLLAWKNYSPGTFLTGWDSLHPEFNFPLYFKRAASGVWRGDQGLGNIAAHAHMADIPRVLILWLLSVVFPVSSLRYFMVFLSLFIGPLGVYFFTKEIFKKSNFRENAASFLASLYYLFNLGTIQHFFVPFEMFVFLYALIPWVFLFSKKYVGQGGKKNLLKTVFLLVLIAPSAYAASLFYVFAVSLLIFLVFIARKKAGLKRTVSVLGLIILLNSYWLLPNLYSVINQSGVISSSKINTLFSPEAYLRNKDYGGDFQNILLHKNFLFSWRGYDFQTHKFVDLLSEWSKHLEIPLVWIIGNIIAAIWILGMFLGLLKKNRAIVALFVMSLPLVIFLTNENYFAGTFYSWMIEKAPVLKEAFRMQFTKFSIPFMLSCAVFFGYFYSFLFTALNKKWLKPFGVGILVASMVGLLYFGKPAFDGNLISPKVRIDIPDEYFQVFDWFEKNSTGRVARLPLNTLYNWEFHDWGYEGSGWFTWFGIDNPILDRDFDRWSPYNESFYGQASFALYNKDLGEFEKILEKYKVNYLLLDESTINTGTNDEVLFVESTKELFKESNNIKLVQENGFLTTYETIYGNELNQFWAPKQYRLVDADLTYSQKDPIYSQETAYVQSNDATQYPFVNLDKRMGVEATFKGNSLEVKGVGMKTPLVFEIKDWITESFDEDRGFKDATNCDLKKLGSVTKEKQEKGVLYKAQDGGVSCDFFYYPNLKHNQGYVLRIKGENKEGRGLKIYFFNPETKRMDLEELLPEGKFDEYFFILPRESEQEGYTLNVETRSFGRVMSENVIDSIEFVPFPYDYLQSIRLKPQNTEIFNSNLEIKETKKYGTSIYKVETKGEGILVLGQGFEKGWVAISNKKTLEHTRVNNWQNGWFVQEGDRELLIIFWPQLLEWTGFVLILILVPLLLTKSKKTSYN